MNLTYSFQKPHDLFEKMERDAAALDDCVTGDRAFNFVITAYHIQDWVISSAETQETKDALKTLTNSKPFQLCRDLANASKHMVITRYDPSAEDASSSQGFGVGRFGKGPFGVGEESIEITHSDGSTINILQLKDEIVSLWSEFFSKQTFNI